MLDSSLLRSYIDTFNGYGDYQAKYWFVGMEEGGGNSLQEIRRRLAKWEAQGRGELLDLMPHHREGDLSSFVSSSGKLQATWRQLIRVVLASEGKPTDNESVRAYQQSQLGRFGGNSCLLELMPLPSPDAKRWLYDQYSSLPELSSRRVYMESYAHSRSLRLRKRIEEHRPAVVVFYSFTYRGWWKEVAGVELRPVIISGVKSFCGRNEYTDFVLISQPAARIKGKGKEYYVQVGKAIGASLRSRHSGVGDEDG